MTNYVVILVIYVITFLIGFPSNLLSLYTFILKVRKKPAPIDVLLLNLTLSDLLFLTFLPLKMREADLENKWPFPQALCNVTSCTFHSTIYISTLFLTAVSVDRYLGVAFPIKYKLNRRLVYAVVASVFIWLLVLSHCSVIYVVASLSKDSTMPSQNSSNTTVCFKGFNKDQRDIMYPFRLELCIVLFCIPFIITCFSYVNVIRILASLPNVEARKKQRAMGLAMITLLNYVVCFAPFNISHIFGVIKFGDPKWRDYAFALSSFNTCLDPFIFFFSSHTIRRNVGACWAGICSRFQPIISRYSLSCCKDARDSDEGGGATGLSTSSGLGGTGTSTEFSTSGHATKMLEISALNPEQETYCTKFQGHEAY